MISSAHFGWVRGTHCQTTLWCRAPVLSGAVAVLEKVRVVEW